MWDNAGRPGTSRNEAGRILSILLILSKSGPHPCLSPARNARPRTEKPFPRSKIGNRKSKMSSCCLFRPDLINRTVLLFRLRSPAFGAEAFSPARALAEAGAQVPSTHRFSPIVSRRATNKFSISQLLSLTGTSCALNSLGRSVTPVDVRFPPIRVFGVFRGCPCVPLPPIPNCILSILSKSRPFVLSCPLCPLRSFVANIPSVPPSSLPGFLIQIPPPR
jgi:hypothetical protein